MSSSTPQSDPTPTSSRSNLSLLEVEAKARGQRARLRAELAKPDPARCAAITAALAQKGIRTAPGLAALTSPADLVARQVVHDTARVRAERAARNR